MPTNNFILEEHSYCKLFRTTSCYAHLTLIQLVLSLAIIGTMLLSEK